MAVNENLTVKPSNDILFTNTLSSDGVTDFTGWTIDIMAKKSLDDPDTSAIYHSGPQAVAANGYIEVLWPNAQTKLIQYGKLFYDYRVKDATGYITNSDVQVMDVVQVVNHGLGV